MSFMCVLYSSTLCNLIHKSQLGTCDSQCSLNVHLPGVGGVEWGGAAPAPKICDTILNPLRIKHIVHTGFTLNSTLESTHRLDVRNRVVQYSRGHMAKQVSESDLGWESRSGKKTKTNKASVELKAS